MKDTWYIIKWVWAVVVLGYLAVQVFALGRLTGRQRKRSNTVLTVMLFLWFGSNAIRDIFFFEDRVAAGMQMVIVAVGAIVAVAILGWLLGNNQDAPDSPNGAEHVRPLKLN